MTKRSIDVAFPDAGVGAPTWRGDAALSDWTLLLEGGREFYVHRVIVGTGARASVFLSRAWATESQAFGSARLRSTDLSDLLPLCCQGSAFEVALDFIYTGSIPPKLPIEDYVRLCKVGDTLQIPALQRACVQQLNQPNAITRHTAPCILNALEETGGMAEPLQRQLELVVSEQMAAHFYAYTRQELESISGSSLANILTQPNLQVLCEDHVFHCARQATASLRTAGERKCLWQHVRFGQLSATALAEAATVEEIPKALFVFLAAARMHLPSTVSHDAWATIGLPPMRIEGLEPEWMCLQHFVPRRAPELQCVYVFFSSRRKAAEVFDEMLDLQFIVTRLEAQGFKVECVNMCKSMDRNTFLRYDVVITGDPIDCEAMHASAQMALYNFIRRGKGIVMWQGVTGALLKEPYMPFTAWAMADDSDEEVVLAAGRVETLIFEQENHPVFNGIDPNPQWGNRRAKVTLRERSRVLARWQDGVPHLVENESGRVLCFTSPKAFLPSEVSVQEQQLFVNAVLYCARQDTQPIDVDTS